MIDMNTTAYSELIDQLKLTGVTASGGFQNKIGRRNTGAL